ncbi:MAG: holo-ACP synthase [Candidatus Micrarchaeota archaeon]
MGIRNPVSVRGIGIDVESISRFRKPETMKAGFVKKTFTGKELAYCNSKRDPAPSLAARYAAKEALFKAFSGMGVKCPGYNNIEILNKENGAPIVRIIKEGYAKFNILVSLSHSGDMAIAFVIIT